MSRLTNPLAILFVAFAFLASAASAQSLTLHLGRDYYLANGSKALENGETEKAAEYFEKALRKDLTASERISAQNSLCAAQFILGQYDAATSHCTAAIDADGDYWKAYVNRGNVRRAQGDTEGALADYCTAHALEPGKVSGAFTAHCPA